MNAQIAALPGQWYRDPSSGGIFQIVGIDEEDRSIDIQHVDGSLEETSFDDWMGKRLESCEQPEDWVGPYDDLESDDIGLPETSMEPRAEAPMDRALLVIEGQRLSLDDVGE